ncbi:hypothetical protein ACFSR9_09050 [Deinococcus taklimakanensis]|uniref:Lipoprotein n=1 Tax=Deinococcus taklimakanensis TaxID=536443 RepID=A0ABW5P2V1_9DEIO
MRPAVALALLALLVGCKPAPAAGPSITLHSSLLGADVPGARPTGPDAAAYERRLTAHAAQFGQACAGTPEVMLSHAPDVLIDDLQVLTGTLWTPIGQRSGVWTVQSIPPLVIAQQGSAVMVCAQAAQQSA